MVKVKIDPGLFDRAKRAAAAAGYSSVEEFIANCIEKEIQRLKVEKDEGPSRRPASRPGIHRMTNALAQAAALAVRRGEFPGTVPARPGRRRAGLAFGHGHRGGDGRAVARRLQVHLESARDQARPQRHQRQPAGAQAVQG